MNENKLRRNVSRVDRQFDMLKFVEKQLKGNVASGNEENSFITEDTWSPGLNGFKIFPKLQTTDEYDYVMDDKGRFKDINPKHESYMKYGATQFLMLIYGDNKEQAKNRAIELIEDNYEDHQEDEVKEGLSYLHYTENGKIKVNTNLLADHIRKNSNYYIVKKQGSDSFFIYWYEDGYYKLISPNELKAKIKTFIPQGVAKPSMWEDTYKDLITTSSFISYEEMNTDIHHINFKNGLLDTRTWKLKEHSPKYVHTFQLKSEYNPKAATPTLWKMFIETLSDGDPEIQNTLQEWFGLTISNYNASICKKALALKGEQGNTGKTKYLKMLFNIIGSENICSKHIQDLSARFGAGALYGKKCVLIDDQKATNIEDGSTFKAITGSGVIEVELKGKEPFPITFNGGITFTCNALPYIKDDKGTHMFERFLIIPCDNVIPPEKRDLRLEEKLEKELEGIILWGLEGLKRLIANNFKLTEAEASKQANREYRYMNDTFFRFMNECFEITGDNKDKVRKTELEAMYEKFCIQQDLTPLERKNIEARAKANGIICKPYDGYKCYRGVKVIIQ